MGTWQTFRGGGGRGGGKSLGAIKLMGAWHDCSQGRLYYSRVKMSYLGLSGLFGNCSGAVRVCRGMFGAPTGLFTVLTGVNLHSHTLYT